MKQKPLQNIAPTLMELKLVIISSYNKAQLN